MSHAPRRWLVWILAAGPWWGFVEGQGSDGGQPAVASQASAAPPATAACPPQLPIRFALPAQPAEIEAPPAESAAPTVARQHPLEVAPGQANRRAALPLSPPSTPRSSPQRQGSPPRPASGLTTAAGSLAVVLAAFAFLVWLARRAAPRSLPPLPAEVVEPLGRAPLAGRQQLQLVRVGRKLVLLSVAPGEARTLTEITDPAEVDRLAGLCQQNRPGSITATFRQILAQSETAAVSRNPRPGDHRPSSERPLRATAPPG